MCSEETLMLLGQISDIAVPKPAINNVLNFIHLCQILLDAIVQSPNLRSVQLYINGTDKLLRVPFRFFASLIFTGRAHFNIGSVGACP